MVCGVVYTLVISVHEKSLTFEASLSYIMTIRPPRARDQDAALPNTYIKSPFSLFTILKMTVINS